MEGLCAAPAPVGPVRLSTTNIPGPNRVATPQEPAFPVLHTPYDCYEVFN